MGVAHSCESYFSIEDSGAATLRNITPYLKTIKFKRNQSANDVSVKDGLRAKKYRPGMRDGEFTLTGIWDDTALTGSRTVLRSLFSTAETVGYEYGPEGNQSGDIKESGECVVTDYEEDSPEDDVVLFSATIKVSGTITEGTFT